MRVLICGLMLALPFGCQRDDSIVAYNAPKEPPRAPADDHASHSDELTWTLPDDWKPLPAGQMRYAAFQAGDDPNLVVTVIALSPNQAILPNINRWEGQIGLPPSSEADAAANVKRIDVGGERFALLDLNGTASEGKPAQTILVAFVERPDHTWYFKLQGDANGVAAQKSKFDRFVESIRFAAHDHAEPSAAPSASPPVSKLPSAPAAGAAPKWDLPAAWQLQPEKPMRIATYRTAADGDAAEVIISKFPAQFGGILDNINRWRNQVGLPPVTNESAVPPGHLAVGATQADVYDYSGTAAPAQRIRVVLVPSSDGEQMWFFKLQGAAEAVVSQQAAFDQFVQSVRF